MDSPPAPAINRQLASIVELAFSEDPVVLIEGPRSVGKSTFLRELAARYGSTVLDLDELPVRHSVTVDPIPFISRPAPVFIDEYQKAPIVLDAIKAELNRDTRPGRFVLTGSTRHDALPMAAQALTGRLARVTIFPFAQAEIVGTEPRVIEGLFSDARALVVEQLQSSTVRGDYLRRVLSGGFPLALERPDERARSRWFDQYLRLTLSRDIQELSRIRQTAQLPRLLTRLAGQTAQLLRIQSLSQDLAMDRSTIENSLQLLEAVFLIHRLSAWGTGPMTRAIGTAKIHVLDSGIAARLLRLGTSQVAGLQPTALQRWGHVLESFVVAEALKQASWLLSPVDAGHWRTRDGDEVDLVLERDDGAIIALEVKAAGRVTERDFRSLRKLRNICGDSFQAGAVLYLGEYAFTQEDRLHVLPIDRFWS